MVENKAVPKGIKEMWANFAKTAVNAAAKGVKKKKPQGRLLWDSSNGNTYIKKKHGELK